MQFLPKGVVRVLSGIPWSKDYRDTRYFNTREEQESYFASKPALYSSATFSYVRATINYIAIDMPIEQLWSANYICYQNQDMGSKWFYAFVDRLEMKAASTTFVYFTVDVMQTWMFDLKPIQAYIKRKHFGLETKGTIYQAGEDIGTGENYVVVRERVVDYVPAGSGTIMLTSTVDISQSGGSFEDPNLVGAEGVEVHNLPSGCDYYLVGDQYGATIYEFFDELKNYPWMSKGIIGATILPDFMLSGVSTTRVSVGGSTMTVGKITGGSTPSDKSVFDGDIFEGFADVPMQKLLMYPYSFVEISLLNGGSLVVKPQYTNNGRFAIHRTAVVSSNPQAKYWLSAYQPDLGYDYSLTMGDFPQCPVQDNSYLMTIGRTERSYEINSNSLMVNTIMSMAGNMLRANVMGEIGAGISGIQQGQRLALDLKYADTISPTLATQAGGSGFNYATGNMGCHIRWKMVDKTHRKIIGDYFNMFGYACKEVETVNPNRMSRFDYVQTSDCHVDGYAPNEDITLIESIYDNGIRFWHDDNIGDFNNNEGRAN